jgi:hypothetical protein
MNTITIPAPPVSFSRYLEAANPESYTRLPEDEWPARVAEDQQVASAFYAWAVENLGEDKVAP